MYDLTNDKRKIKEELYIDLLIEACKDKKSINTNQNFHIFTNQKTNHDFRKYFRIRKKNRRSR